MRVKGGAASLPKKRTGRSVEVFEKAPVELAPAVGCDAIRAGTASSIPVRAIVRDQACWAGAVAPCCCFGRHDGGPDRTRDGWPSAPWRSVAEKIGRVFRGQHTELLSWVRGVSRRAYLIIVVSYVW